MGIGLTIVLAVVFIIGAVATLRSRTHKGFASGAESGPSDASCDGDGGGGD